MIIQDPSEFVNLGLDCCDKQKSQTVKTQACKLLENMCDNVDSATTCVTTFACNALDLALKKASGVQAPTPMFSQYGLWNMENDVFLQRPPVLVAETCILALTVISYILPKKDHLVPIF